jgi:ribonuclease BN (tRNA processing enzyme)
MARACRARRLALVHIQRDIRRERFDEIRKLARSIQDVEVIIPEPGDKIII